ncbi:hypothetical protein V2G26_017779 [Clonostachys chloroleuca]
MSPDKAFLACHACRRLKRRCTKDLPACGLCVRLHKPCKYPGLSTTGYTASSEAPGVRRASPPPDDSPASSSRNVTYTFSGAEQPFPQSFFLDAAFTSPLAAESLTWGYQPQVEKQAKQHFSINRQAICDQYLSKVHPWIPFISKKNLRKDLKADKPDAGFTMLLLCMKLSFDVPKGQPSTSALYTFVRHLCMTAESSGALSLRIVQANVLLAAYEIFHAVYPAAFTNISRAARLGMLLGMPDNGSSTPIFKDPETRTLREEMRRTWWTIYILDRCLHIEPNGMPFAVPDFPSDQLLPVDDDDWDRGRIMPGEPVSTSVLTGVAPLGCFAKTCQAIHLLDRVLQHAQASNLSQHTAQNTASLTAEALQFDRILNTLQLSLENDEAGDDGEKGQDTLSAKNSALAICVSARFILYENYGCTIFNSIKPRVPSAQETQMQKISLEGCRTQALHMVPMIASTEGTSPLIARCLYDAATICAWFIRQDHEPEMYEALRAILARLRSLGERWIVAGEYMDLLDLDGVLKLNNLDLVVLG